VQPILELVSEATGWKCSMIAGGPEPAHEGRLNMIGYALFFYPSYLAENRSLVFTPELQLAT